MMSNSNYSIGLQRLKPVHTAYGAICMHALQETLLMHWHHSSTSQVLGTRRKWPRPRRLPSETETGRWYVSRPRSRDRDHNPGSRAHPNRPDYVSVSYTNLEITYISNTDTQL